MVAKQYQKSGSDMVSSSLKIYLQWKILADTMKWHLSTCPTYNQRSAVSIDSLWGYWDTERWSGLWWYCTTQSRNIIHIFWVPVQCPFHLALVQGSNTAWKRTWKHDWCTCAKGKDFWSNIFYWTNSTTGIIRQVFGGKAFFIIYTDVGCAEKTVFQSQETFRERDLLPSFLSSRREDQQHQCPDSGRFSESSGAEWWEFYFKKD